MSCPAWMRVRLRRSCHARTHTSMGVFSSRRCLDAISTWQRDRSVTQYLCTAIYQEQQLLQCSRYPGFSMCWLDITALGHCRRSHPNAPMSHPTPGQTLKMHCQADLQDGFKASEEPVRDLSDHVATCAPQSSQRTMPMKSCTTPSMSDDSWRAPSGVKIGAGRAAAPPSGSASS